MHLPMISHFGLLIAYILKWCVLIRSTSFINSHCLILSYYKKYSKKVLFWNFDQKLCFLCFLSEKCFVCGTDQVQENRIFVLFRREFIPCLSRFFEIEFISSGRLCPNCIIYISQLAPVIAVPNLTIRNCPDPYLTNQNFKIRWIVSFTAILYNFL